MPWAWALSFLRGRGPQIGLGLLFGGGGLAESDHCDDRPNEGDHGDDGGGGQHAAQDAGAFAQRGGVRLGGLLAFLGGALAVLGGAQVRNSVLGRLFSRSARFPFFPTRWSPRKPRGPPPLPESAESKWPCSI
jgi:hypothetical protein